MATILIGIVPVSGAKDLYPLVKSNCSYTVVDVYTKAVLVQDYLSNSPIECEIDYVFPLPQSAAVCSFKAIIDDRVIKGTVLEKTEAKQGYEDAVKQGKSTGLLEKAEADVFRISLGNVKHQQKISVHISFVSIIDHDAKFPNTLRLTIPLTIAPRPGTPSTTIHPANVANCMELSVAVKMTQPITSIVSLTHPIDLSLGSASPVRTGNFNPSIAYVSLVGKTFLQTDIVVVITVQNLDIPRCMVERSSARSEDIEVTDAYALTFVPRFDVPALPSQEYIFLVDRSRSMGGSRITSVKTSLQIMLRSLPTRNSYFNIISFGGTHSLLWPKARMYSSESVDEASKHVDSMEANMSGTEIRKALQAAFNSRITDIDVNGTPVPTVVFLLTDGEAWDQARVINVVEQATSARETVNANRGLLRVFVLGVGDSVSVAMCEGIARSGKGTAAYVARREVPDVKLMTLLRAARGAPVEDVTVDWGQSEEEGDDRKVEEKFSKVESASVDDFEMVSSTTTIDSEITAVAVPPPPINPAPLSLFDTSTPPLGPNLGPQRSVVNLPPPPRIQQAPRSDKISIPLYPGFRCSVFAIIRQRKNCGDGIRIAPFSHNVNVKGKVAGREVSLEVPVTPVQWTLANGFGEDGGSPIDNAEYGLLHVLAARALVQDFEDQGPGAPEIKAQIERLGKKYSLATSTTSFLAIDENGDINKHRMRASDVAYQAQHYSEEPSRRGDIGKGWEVQENGPLFTGKQWATTGQRSNTTSNLVKLGSSQLVNKGSPSRLSGLGGFWASRSKPKDSVSDASALLPMSLGPKKPDGGSHSKAPTVEQMIANSALAQGSSRPYPEPTSTRSWNPFKREQSRHSVVAVASPPLDLNRQTSLAAPTTASDPIPPVSENFCWRETSKDMGVVRRKNRHSGEIRSYKQSPQKVSQHPTQMAVSDRGFPQSSYSTRRSASMATNSSIVGSAARAESIDTYSSLDASVAEPPREPLRMVALQSPIRDMTFNSIQGFKPPLPADSTDSDLTVAPLTLEGIARAQAFDGSFPFTDGFIAQLRCKGRDLPELPEALRNLAGGEGDKKIVWITVLTLAVLGKRFGEKRAAWEMLEEKARAFLESYLTLRGVGTHHIASTVQVLEFEAKKIV